MVDLIMSTSFHLSPIFNSSSLLGFQSPFIGYAGEPETVSCSYVVFDGVDAVNVSWDAVADAHKYKVVIECVDDVEGITAPRGRPWLAR